MTDHPGAIIAPPAQHQLPTTRQGGGGAAWGGGAARGGAMFAPGWSVIHITGEVITKAQALEMCRAPRTVTEIFKVDDLSVRVFGDAAVVTGRTTAATGGAKPSTLTLRFTDVFVHLAGRWQIVASQATQLRS